MKNLTLENVQKYIAALKKKGLGRDIVERKLSSINKFLEWAHDKGRISHPEFISGSAILNQILKQVQHDKKGFNFLSIWLNGILRKFKRHPERSEGSDYNRILRSTQNDTGLGIQHYIGIALVLVLMATLGAGAFNQFFNKAPTPFAFPSQPTKPAQRYVSFQGRVTDSLGNPITAATNFQFNLYTAKSGGSSLYASGTCSLSPDLDGILNVLVGGSGLDVSVGVNVCGTGIPANIFSDFPNVYLGITIGTDTEAQPRQIIANVGYAVNAETLQGFPPGTGKSTIPYLDLNGDVLIATSGASIKSLYESANFTLASSNSLILQSAGPAAGAGDIILQATGSGALRFRTAGATDTQTRLIVDNTGNVGIGTTGPNYKLSLGNSLANTKLALYDTGTGTSYGLGIQSNQFRFNINTPSTDRFSFLDSEAGNEIVTIKGTGNVGIGNTSPVGKLDVSGAVTGKALTIFNETGDQSPLVASESGNTVFTIAHPTGTIVNGFTLTPSVTTAGVAFAATGTDTNIALSIDAKGTGALNLNNTATGDVLLAGGSGSTGCTVTNSTGALACSGAITTTATSGNQGWWNRTGTTLSPVTAGDAVTTSGNISTSGTGTGTFAGLLTASSGITSSNAVNITGGYGPTSGAATTLKLGAGGTSPNSSSISWGDGSGWNLNFGPIITGTFTPKITFVDSGAATFASTLTASNGLTLTTGALNLTATSGAAALTLTSSLTAFNVNSGIFDIDTTNSRVGIGTAAPSATLDVQSTRTSGNLAKVSATSAVTQAGAIVGMTTDLSNYTPSGGFDLTANNIKFPSISIGAADANNYTFTGYDTTSGATPTITQAGAGVVNSYGISLQIPNIVQTAGTVNAWGMRITTGSITTGGVENGIRIVASGVGAGSLTGVNISTLTTPGAGTETAIAVGSGWDNAININSGALTLNSNAIDSSGALSLGTTNATGITIGHTGITTAVNGALTQTYTGTGTASTFTANSVTGGNAFTFSATGITTGNIIEIASPTGLTQGSLIDMPAVTVAHTTGGQANLINLTFTEASTNTSGNTTNGIRVQSNLNFSPSSIATTGVVGVQSDFNAFTSCANNSSTCNVLAFKTSVPSISLGASDTASVSMIGFKVASGTNTFTVNNGSSVLTFAGADIASPNIVGTLGTVSATGVNVANGNVTTTGTQTGVAISTSTITTAGTQNGISITSSNVAAGSLNAIKIGQVGGNSTSKIALNVDQGWNTFTQLQAQTAYTQTAANFSGIVLDYNTLFTPNSGFNITAYDLKTPALTISSGSTTTSYTGYSISTAGALVTQTLGAPNINWTGETLTLPTISNGRGGTVAINGISLTVPSSVISAATGTTTANAISIPTIATGPAAGTLTGINIGNITTPGVGTENALSIGTGWDQALVLSGTPIASTTLPFIQLGGVLASGSANGTYLGANPAAFTGNFFEFQVGGVSKAKLDNAGVLTVTSCTGCGAASVLLNTIAAATGTSSIDSTSNAIVWNWNSLSTQTGMTFGSSANTLTSGTLFNTSLTQSNIAANVFTGSLINATQSTTLTTAATTTAPTSNVIASSRTYVINGATALNPSGSNTTLSDTYTATAGNIAMSGNILAVSRGGSAALSQTLNISGALAAFTDNALTGAGTLTHSGKVLALTQSNTNATGDVLTIANSGTGKDISGTSNTWNVTKAGLATFTTGTIIATQTFTTNNITDSGALTINSTGANALTLDSTTSGIVNVGNGSTGKTVNVGSGGGGNTINIAGTGATGADAINIGTGGTGADTIIIGNNASSTSLALTSGTGSQTHTSSVVTGTGATSAFVFVDNALTSGNGIDLSTTANGLTSGTLLNVSASQTAATGTAVSRDIANFSFSPTYSTAITTPAITGQVLDISRATTTNTSFASTLTVSGAVATIADNCTQTTGTCTNTANVLSLTQSYAAASGAVLAIANSGTGNDILGTSSTWSVSKAGAATFASIGAGTVGTGKFTTLTSTGATDLANAGASNVTIATTGTGTVTIGNSTGTFALTSSGGLNVTTAGALTGVASLDTISTSATALTFAGAGTITGTTTLTLNSTGANALTLDSTTTGAVNIGNNANAKTITIGNNTGATALNLTSGTGSQTYTSSVVSGTGATSAFVFNGSAITSGTTLRLTSTSTSGILFDQNATNTSGTINNLAYGAATTQAGNITGVNLDFNTNLAGQVGAAADFTGLQLKTLPAVTETGNFAHNYIAYNLPSPGAITNQGTSAFNFTGFSLTTPGAVIQNTAAGTINWKGVNITMPAITQTTGTVTASGISVTIPASAAITTAGTMNGINVVAPTTSGPAAGTLNGVNIANLTSAGAGTETALNVGTGWDIGINIAGGAWEGGTTARTIDAFTTNTTTTITDLVGLGYRVANDIGTTAGVTVTATYNFTTGIQDVNNAFYIFSTEAKKGVSATASTSQVEVQINGTRVGLTTTGTATTAATDKFHTFLVIKIGGAWRSLNTNSGNNDVADLAENIPYVGEKSPQPGQIVSIANTDVAIQQSKSAYDNKAVGVVSTNPAILLSDQTDHAVGVALTGRIPVIVTSLNGKIQNGDYITTSDLTGIGMKQILPGKAVGQALESFDPTQKTCTAVVSYPSVSWPEDDGSNPAHPCFKIPVSSFDSNTQGILFAKYHLSANDSIYVGKVMLLAGSAFADPGYTLTSSGDLQIALNQQNQNNDESQKFNLLSSTGEVIKRIGAYSELAVSYIKAGFINAQEILAENITSTNKITSPIVETADIKASGEAQLNQISTNLIKPQNKDLTVILGSEATPESVGDSGQARMTGEESGPLAKIIIKGLNGKTVSTIDAAGNASFSGTLSAKDASISGTIAAGNVQTNEASITGKLTAKEIESDTINQLKDRLTLAAADSGQARMTSQELSTSVNNIQSLLADIRKQPLSDPQYYQNLDNNPVVGSLVVSGDTTLYNATIANSLTAGTISIKDNQILSQTTELKLSALSSVNILDGAVVIARDGTMTTKGTIIAKGGIEVQNSAVRFTNSQGVETASIDASGSAKFKSLALDKYLDATSSAIIATPEENFNKNGLFASAIETQKQTAGVGIVPVDSNEIVIYNQTVKDDSLIYLTPTTQTSSQLTVSQKLSCGPQSPSNCKPYFKVASNQPIHPEIGFNWLIIN